MLFVERWFAGRQSLNRQEVKKVGIPRPFLFLVKPSPLTSMAGDAKLPVGTGESRNSLGTAALMHNFHIRRIRDAFSHAS